MLLSLLFLLSLFALSDFRTVASAAFRPARPRAERTAIRGRLVTTRRAWGSIFLLALAFLVGCRNKPAGPLTVVVSVPPLMDITQRIAGADARVALAMEVAKDGSGALTVRSQDKDILATASLAVLVGLGLDERLEKELKGLPKPPRFFKAGDRVPTLSIDGGDGPADPRVWMDPARMRLIVKALGEELARVDGAHAGAYRSRASALDEKLDGLEKELAQTMAPFEGRSVAVEGGTMLYFADRYALRVALRLPKGTALQSTGAPMVLLRDTQGGDPTESAATPGLTSYRIVPVNSFGDGPAPVYEEILRRGAAALTAAWRP